MKMWSNFIKKITCTRIFNKRFFHAFKKYTVALLITLLVFSDISTLFISPWLHQVEAAQVTIDATTSSAQSEHVKSGVSSVFISDQVGYKFYVNSTGRCEYSKTTDGGTSWGASVIFDNTTSCASPTVWYDQWTPGDTGDYIHIISLDPNNAREYISYNRLDTTNDTLLLGTTPVNTMSNSGQTGTYSNGANKPNLTKGSDGTIYIAVADNTDSFVLECSGSCNLTTGWTETGTNPMDLTNDWPLMMPLSGGDIMLIVRDVSANDIEYKIWNNSTWSGTWTTIDSNALENTVYDVGMSAVAHPDTNDIYLVYTADTNTLGTDDDLRTTKYTGGSWSTQTNILTDDARGITQVAMAIDENTDEVYVAYSVQATAGSATTADVYWVSSTNGMGAWSSETGPVNTTSGNIYAVDLNYYSDERIYVSWYEDGLRDVFGDTIADIGPITVVSATGTQATQVRASTTDFYTGGAFVITENVASRNVTDIEIAEYGTIDGSVGIGDIELWYDLDTSAPYDCSSESYAGGGSETQFGSTDTNGFSGADGISHFADVVTISPTQTMCVYTVLEVHKEADDGTTIDIKIDDPTTDVVVTGGVTPIPASIIEITGDTDVVDDDLTLTHYHWRNDDGNEAGATSATGGTEDTPIPALQSENPRRLRIGLSNEGSTTTLPTTFRLEWGVAAPNCTSVASWTDVGATDDDWNMSASANLTNGADTTDIAVASGGVTDENTTFLTPNGAVRDTSSETGSLQIDFDEYTALEYSIVASTTATEGNTYCFRVTNQGEEISAYDAIPQVTISADVSVAVSGTQTATVDIPSTDFYIGGVFSITENTGSRNVTDLTITETGTVDGASGVDDIKLFYDLDTSAPYDCSSESYSGTEAQFGGTAAAFSSENGTSTFSGSVGITTTATMCAYVVLDVNENALNGETINITIDSAASDIVVSGGGSVAPSTVLDMTASTTLNGAIVTQTHYHWRNDDGDETGATSATGGNEDTFYDEIALETPVRLRIGISNEGATTSIEHAYNLEYGIKITTCDVVTVWTDVGASADAWDMYDSANVTHGDTTTNLGTASGGVTDENVSFLGTNSNVRETTSYSATTTLSQMQYTDIEYSLTTTPDTVNDTSYCFRVTANGTPLLAYDNYAEVTIAPKRDFRVQHGTTDIYGTSTVITAGSDYTAPAGISKAFIRITNMHHTGAGFSTPGGGSQNADDYGVYILNPENLLTSIRFARDTDSINHSRVSWEIVEFVGDAATDNEMVVRDQGLISYADVDTVATGTAVVGIADDADVVVFITGQAHRGGNRSEGFAHQSTASWSSGSDEPVIERGATGNNAGFVSYAVVEFTGLNWKVQRSEHQYSAAGASETESITAVNSLSRTFLHTQKRHTGSSRLASFGHEVTLSSMGAITYYLQSTAEMTVTHTSVAWVIENTQTSNGAMNVQRNSGATTAGAEPVSINIPIPVAVGRTDNTSLFSMSRHNQTGAGFPRVLAGVSLISTTTYQIWRSEAGSTLSYATEIVEWPVANFAIRQNYYRFYVEDGNLDPIDPWPLGGTDLGENTSITSLDEPLAEGEQIRIRMSSAVSNATLPAGLISMKLQYGQVDTTCSAIGTWFDVGDTGSGSIWRGYDVAGLTDGVDIATSTPSPGTLNLSVSDVAASYVEENPSPANPFVVSETQDVEYDWVVEHNGAAESSSYCFRMVQNDGTPLDGYLQYPQLRTAGFNPIAGSWRWYDDHSNETPLTALAAEDVAPINISNTDGIALRIAVDELKNVTGNAFKMKLQFSEYADFTTVTDVVASSTCTATDLWCYVDGGGADNAVISTASLSSVDACIAGVGNGCGTHNASGALVAGHNHLGGAHSEYSFTIQHAGARANAVYYFRLYDVTNDVVIATNATNPSLQTEGAGLVFTISGVDEGTTIGAVVTDATTTASSVAFTSVPFDSEYELAHRLTIDTNATEGYQVLMYTDQLLTDSYGSTIPAVTGSNLVPTGWATGCSVLATGCFGYHTTDDSLLGASTRFAADDTYAAFSTSPQEIMYRSTSANESHDIVYKLQVGNKQTAGEYEKSITYIAIPIF